MGIGRIVRPHLEDVKVNVLGPLQHECKGGALEDDLAEDLRWCPSSGGRCWWSEF